MPNAWTHILFVDDLCERIHRKDLLLTSSIPLHIGAQGPDPFFYHRFLPFLPKGSGELLGMQLHTERCGPFLINMIQRGKQEKNSLQAFILGFVSHHYLDRVTHPYVHYHAGYKGNKHQELEVAIDTVMLDRFRNIKTWKEPLHKEIRPHTYLTKITELLTNLIVDHYPEWPKDHTIKLVRQSYKDMYHAQRILFDPWYWKNKWLGRYVSSFSHQPLQSNRDYLNESKNTWYHSATKEASSETFLELYESAVRQGADLIEDILQYWSTPSWHLLDSIKTKVDDISYDTGRPLQEKRINSYSSPIV